METLFTSILKPAKQVDIAYQGRTSLAVRRVSWAHERDNHLVTHSLALAYRVLGVGLTGRAVELSW